MRWQNCAIAKCTVQRTKHLRKCDSFFDEDTIAEIESILWANERPSRERFHQGRNEDYRTHGVEMHISEIGLCSGHSASGGR